MGAKTSILVYADQDARVALSARPQLDRARTATFARTLFAGETLTPQDDGTLLDTSPPDDEIVIGCFPGVTIVAAKECGVDRPSTLSRRFIDAGKRGRVTLHAMHSSVDWFAFACWSEGTLMRSLSLSPDSGVIEDVGAKLPFEQPYWGGEHPAVDPEEDEQYPLPFHPLELGEAALDALFGFQLEGGMMSALIDPEDVVLMRFTRSKAKPWWRVW